MKPRILTYRLWIVLLILWVIGDEVSLHAQELLADSLATDNTSSITPITIADSIAIDTTSIRPIAIADSITIDSLQQMQILRLDSLSAPIDTAKLYAGSDSIMKKDKKHKKKERFIPDPQKATWLALLIPGGGQIYNRKYWKLPIVYGGFVGCAYALTWNNQMYQDYSQAYLDIMDDDPTTESYRDFLSPNYRVEGNESQLQTIFQRKKDYYRRYRDLSIFAFIAVYILSVIDAYVDAELSNFDISKDLSMKVEPTMINNTSQQQFKFDRRTGVGLQCSINF